MCLQLGLLHDQIEENKEEYQYANIAVIKKFSHEIGKNYI